MKKLNKNSIFIILIIITSIFSCKLPNSNIIPSFKNNNFEKLIGEWYLMEVKYDDEISQKDYFEKGVKWRIFSDSSILIIKSPYSEEGIRDQFYRYIPNTNPGNINLFKLESDSNFNILILFQKNMFNNKKKNSFENIAVPSYLSIEEKTKQEIIEKVERKKEEDYNNQFNEIERYKIIEISNDKMVLELKQGDHTLILSLKK